MAGSELRAPLFAQAGRYDALDFRNMIGRTRGHQVGPAGPEALAVTKVGDGNSVSVAAGSVWLPDDVQADHEGAVYFAHLDQAVTLAIRLPGAGGKTRTDLVIAYADPDGAETPAAAYRSTAGRFMQPVWYSQDGTPYSENPDDLSVPAGASRLGSSYTGGWTIAVVEPSAPGLTDWRIPDNAVILAKVESAETGVSGVQDYRFRDVSELIRGQLQVDTTPLRHLRTAGDQTVGQLARIAPAGSLIYDHKAKTMVVVTDQAQGYVKGLAARRQTRNFQQGDWDNWFPSEPSPQNWMDIGAITLDPVPYDRNVDVIYNLTAKEVVGNADYQVWLRVQYNGADLASYGPQFPGRGAEINLNKGHARVLPAGQALNVTVQGGCQGGWQWKRPSGPASLIVSDSPA
ncbi:hypothetical protein ACWCYY_18290 [Kitasatospora sp. NPDC001664]